MKLKTPLAVLMAFLPFAFAFENAHGDMMITVETKQIASESFDFVDVFVTSNADSNVKLAGYAFKIQGTNGNTSQLVFRDSFVENNIVLGRQSNSEQSLDNYLFRTGNAVGRFAAIRNTELELSGGDASTLDSGFNMVANQTYLLTRLEVQSIEPGQGTFTISMIQDSNRSFFERTDGALVPNITFNSGTLSITAVPEPATWLLVGTALIGVGLRSKFRSRKVRTGSDPLR